MQGWAQRRGKGPCAQGSALGAESHSEEDAEGCESLLGRRWEGGEHVWRAAGAVSGPGCPGRAELAGGCLHCLNYLPAFATGDGKVVGFG